MLQQLEACDVRVWHLGLPTMLALTLGCTRAGCHHYLRAHSQRCRHPQPGGCSCTSHFPCAPFPQSCSLLQPAALSCTSTFLLEVHTAGWPGLLHSLLEAQFLLKFEPCQVTCMHGSLQPFAVTICHAVQSHGVLLNGMHQWAALSMASRCQHAPGLQLAAGQLELHDG